jgi:Zn-dependent metalloprotease
MRDFKNAVPPYTYERNDYGHVHDNSGIHNYAAYRIMTAKAGGKYVFTPKEIAAMFYIALTLQLSRTSQFADSRRAVVQAARSLFRNETKARRERKVRAAEKGFGAAGVT